MKTKELTIEEKAKAYDEALKVLHKYDGVNIMFSQSLKEEMFPELAESEESKEERIINNIKKVIGWYRGMFTEKSLMPEEYQEIDAWLEKQGEQKPAEVEPKFHEGDWVIDKQNIVHQIANVIENVTYHTYGYDIVGGGYFNDNTEGVRLWTIQDAKEGDVLYMDNGLSTFTFIYKSINNVVIQKYASYNKFGFEGTTYFVLNDGYVCPATKEQRDLLFQKMKEAGYEWNAEKKELKKIEQKSWSEEDEEHLNSIIGDIKTDMGAYSRSKEIIDIYNDDISFLKSLKDRVQPQRKQEWSEEDEREVDILKAYICSREWSDSHIDRALGIVDELVKKLKSLRPQSTWRPSEDEMKALSIVMCGVDDPLFSLYQDLKKLREE